MTTETLAPVKAAVTVNVGQQQAFEYFTANFADWWPVEGHSILDGCKGAALEPREGGRWYEFGDSGECDWGRVIAWEPPGRLLLAWQLNADWDYDPDLVTEVEVTFTPEGEGTRVALEHRHLERFGDRAAEVRDAIGSQNGWTGLLAAYAAGVSEGSM
jgi:uncharacterized protein YndB with AHSA1/START domain